ncbi:MAG: hypothetical protein ACI9GH_000243 [Candidatus Paceibacteria bacterium]|jgi:hypothetical protein
MDYKDHPGFKAAHARDLTGSDRILYRFLEMVPGLLSWGTIFLIVALSYFKPVWAAYFIIAFDLYWLLKTVYLSIHHRHNWKRLKHNTKVDWQKMISNLKYEHIKHMILLPFYQESETVIDQTMKSLLATKYKKNNMIIVLAAEARAGKDAMDLAEKMKAKYEKHFGEILITSHPEGLPGEIKGKGPNITYAAEQSRIKILDPQNISYEDCIVSAFDMDTVVGEQYFLCLTWHYLTTEDPNNTSFQPVPLYNNNIWQAPALSRVAAMTSTFWQMIQQERPEKLTTFSSHSLSFKSLYEVGYWQKNMISDDSRIFWNMFLAKDGNYKVVPISYPISMDANLAGSYWQTTKNIYKQHLRWMWGVENIPYMLFGFIKNKNISLGKKIRHTIIQIEGFWSLATNPLVILLLGWLPLVLGGSAFRDTVLSYNLPLITRNLMTFAMAGLILSAIIGLSLVPKMGKEIKRKKRKWASLTLQWLLVPFTIIVFGSFPGLDAQTRLMTGRYIGEFWVTPKHRK